jgi:hypothetical protein
MQASKPVYDEQYGYSTPQKPHVHPTIQQGYPTPPITPEEEYFDKPPSSIHPHHTNINFNRLARLESQLPTHVKQRSILTGVRNVPCQPLRWCCINKAVLIVLARRLPLYYRQQDRPSSSLSTSQAYCSLTFFTPYSCYYHRRRNFH